MIKLSITFAVTFVFSVGKRSCQVTWNQTMDVIWCDVMSDHAILCHVKFVMIWYQFHVTLRHFMSCYIISDYASSHQVICYQYGMLYWTYLFFCRFWNLCRDVLRHHSARGLLRCCTWKIRFVDSANHPKEGISFPEGKVPSVARSDRYHFITLISKMIY